MQSICWFLGGLLIVIGLLGTVPTVTMLRRSRTGDGIYGTGARREVWAELRTDLPPVVLGLPLLVPLHVNPAWRALACAPAVALLAAGARSRLSLRAGRDW